VLSPDDWTTQLMEYLGRTRADGLAGVSTGLRDLDKMTLAGQVALHVAEHHGPVIFVSMELTAADLGVRPVAVITNIT
jgi:replicative DNA helicase